MDDSTNKPFGTSVPKPVTGDDAVPTAGTDQPIPAATPGSSTIPPTEPIPVVGEIPQPVGEENPAEVPMAEQPQTGGISQDDEEKPKGPGGTTSSM